MRHAWSGASPLVMLCYFSAHMMGFDFARVIINIRHAVGESVHNNVSHTSPIFLTYRFRFVVIFPIFVVCCNFECRRCVERSALGRRPTHGLARRAECLPLFLRSCLRALISLGGFVGHSHPAAIDSIKRNSSSVPSKHHRPSPRPRNRLPSRLLQSLCKSSV